MRRSKEIHRTELGVKTINYIESILSHVVLSINAYSSVVSAKNANKCSLKIIISNRISANLNH